MKHYRVDKEHVKLKAFPFFLKEATKAWLFSILPSSIYTWNGMKKIFLGKYFPASRVANIRKEICGIRQSHEETLFEYRERFEQIMHSMLSSSNTQFAAHSIFLWRTDAYWPQYHWCGKWRGIGG
jgi:hypothetical protein